MKIFLYALELLAAAALGLLTGWFIARISLDSRRHDKIVEHLKRWHVHMAKSPTLMTAKEIHAWTIEHERLEDEGEKLHVTHLHH